MHSEILVAVLASPNARADAGPEAWTRAATVTLRPTATKRPYVATADPKD